jgi:uncharacterized membrane protein
MLLCIGSPLYALATIGIGVETILCAGNAAHSLGPQYAVIPVIPWIPAIPWLAYLFGILWVACGVALLSKTTSRVAALTLGTLLLVCAVFLDAPKSLAHAGSIALRTTLFEPLALAAFAWLLPGQDSIHRVFASASRYILAVSLVVFGFDHFLALGFIATLIPSWIPWHAFWVAFFGAAFIAGGVSIGLNWMQRWGAAGIGLMFAIWVVTLHLPRVLGLYAIPGAPRDPNEWSSLLIAIALWGGAWALAAGMPRRAGARSL